MTTARSMWNGAIRFGLVTIPVKLFTAVTDRELKFNQVHQACGNRTKQVLRCEECKIDLQSEDLQRVYEYSPGKYVPIGKEDLEGEEGDDKAIGLEAFVAPADIAPMLHRKAYYVGPDKAGHHAYSVLHAALRKSKTVGVGRISLRSKEDIAIVRPHGHVLTLELVHYAEEITAPDGIDYPEPEDAATRPELKMAIELVEKMTRPFILADYPNERTERLLKVIEARVQKSKPPPARARRAAPSLDLREALSRSLAEAGP